MKIWRLRAEVDKYENLCPVKDLTADEIQAFDGHPIKDKWKPLPVEPLGKGKRHKWCDYPGFTIPAMSENALRVLRPLIENSSEELELDFSEKKYVAVNVTAVLDVIDYDRADYEKFSNSDRIMLFNKYAFRECEELKQHHIFKIVDQKRSGWPFVSDTFKQTVEENGLTGFEFQLVWDSEELSDQERAAPTTVGEKEHDEEVGQKGQSASETEGFTYVGDLDDEVMSEINSVISYARKVFWIPKSSNGRDLATRVRKAVDKVINTGRYPRQYEDIEDVAVALGCLFGEALVTGYGWKWKAVGKSAEDAVFSVVSPDENFVNPCMVYLQKILKGENENTTLLLYNMIENTMKQKPEHKLTFLM
ncbi:MAG: hypothetical protein IJL09_03195 [Lachnospiraceae bacterium]|nr:hypothetical protein [Lachnospiraceae bacterium]